MNKLKKYDNTIVRIDCDFGDCISGPCVWNDSDYGKTLFNHEEESLKIGDIVIFADQITNIELLRGEVCIPVREWPEAAEEIAQWFHEKWNIPAQIYLDSIRECLGNEYSVPQWYVIVRGQKIIGGCGVIENDFHDRKDLSPNVCAVYVEEEYRNQGIAGFMLDYVSTDMARLGYPVLYLLTDHTGFYERYGWQFLCEVKGNDGELSRMYVHHA